MRWPHRLYWSRFDVSDTATGQSIEQFEAAYLAALCRMLLSSENQPLAAACVDAAP